MYYEEKWIESKLMYKTTPEGEWEEVDQAGIRTRFIQANHKISQLQEEITRLEYELDIVKY